ncbi:hypothetical protein OE88DRAFT_188698 [Heliocybe sulcata]|uniref:Membrane-associated protein n=1 Tax=Heliocybe sulcata TaxID=5364 RepID=A0A5C3N368_9AGAM|nr:hypothetical protein OE88DRAFT_188698 [Heliocybe sulcata]
MISGRSRAVIAAWAFTGIIVLLLNDTRTNAANPGESNVACTAYEWTYNSLHQSPCLVASYTISACSTSAIAVPSGICGYALTPSLLTLAAPCLCSLVVYNLLSACSACQNCSVPSSLVPWHDYLTNCSTFSLTGYPQPIPPGTSVPAWAYLPASNDYWDANSAENDIGAPESTPPSQSTSSTASSTAVSSAVMSTTMSASSTNTSASSMSSASASATTGSDSHSAPRKGAIAGGVAAVTTGASLTREAFYGQRAGPFLRSPRIAPFRAEGLREFFHL